MPTRRVIVLSDLHLGGEPPRMMSHPRALEGFLGDLRSLASREQELELVIAGDFIDFLAIEPSLEWTPDPAVAVRRLDSVAAIHPNVFSALGALIRQRVAITIIVGNHDVEFALPQTQDRLLSLLGASRHDVLFVDDGRAYRNGRLLVEHGNRYDGANAVDWQGVRAVASVLSRNERPEARIEVPAGTEIVQRVVNAIKPRYPFIDLLQPQGELVALLLLCFEPSLMLDIGNLARILRAKRFERARSPRANQVAAVEGPDEPDEELADLFQPEYDAMRQARTQRASGEWIAAWRDANRESWSERLRNGELIPAESLRRVQALLARMLLDDRSSSLDGPTEQYGAAAQRMLGGEMQTVVMGHTHLAREVGVSQDRATYLNTGTWADVVRIPRECLAETADGQASLSAFLRGLLMDSGVRVFQPTFADIVLSADGEVLKARLGRGRDGLEA